MKNRNKLIMSGLLALTLGLGVSSATFAYQGDYTKKGPNYSQEFESEMTRVMLNNDYDGWRNLVENKVGRVDELITRENFPKFAEAWRLAKEGKIKYYKKRAGFKNTRWSKEQSSNDERRTERS